MLRGISILCGSAKRPVKHVGLRFCSSAHKYAYDTSVLKAAGIDIAANNFTAMLHFRGSW